MQLLFTLETVGDIFATWVHPCLRGKSSHISDLDRNPRRAGFHLCSWYISEQKREIRRLFKETEKIYKPSGRGFSSISHEHLAVFSCEAGKGVLFFDSGSDCREQGFCVELWECGSRRSSVDTENKVGLDRLKVPHNESIVSFCCFNWLKLDGSGRPLAV